MKKLLLLACSMLVAAGVYAQGTVNFANGAAGVNSPIYYVASPTMASTANGPWLAMLYAGPSGAAASALSDSIVSGTASPLGATPGYVLGGARTITGIPAGTAATLQIRAWHSSLGATFPAGAIDGTRPGTGVSTPITVTLGGGATPTPNMVGLASFAVTDPVPEPSSIALGLLGLGAIALIRRRK